MERDLGSSTGTFVWNGGDSGGGYGGGGGDQYFAYMSSSSQNNSAGDGYYPISSDAANERLPKANNQQATLDHALSKLQPLGLQLHVPSLLNLMEDKQSRPNSGGGRISHLSSCSQARDTDFVSQPISEKLKASNFAASYLKIGSWEITSKNEGDLVAKCYFAKKKLVWELLKGGLKSKIEIQWSDIIGIRATIRENEQGILELEV
ncbi:hypothetical protein Tsubulata_041840, partial [Turnera subulata]